MSSTRDSKAQAKIKQQLLDLLKLPENKYCAECGLKQPRWASANLGCFICIKCSGIHRSLGVHITKVRSVTLDTWTQEMADIISNIGNEKANAYWEYNLPEGRKPGPNDTTYALESFIKDKYCNKRFIKKGSEPPTGKSVGSTKKSKSKKKVEPKEEPEPKEESGDEESSEEEEETPKPKKKSTPTAKPKKAPKKEEAKAAEPAKKSPPKVVKETPRETVKEAPKETPRETTKGTTKDDDLLTFNNWAETIPTGADDFGSFFTPEPTTVTAPAPAPAPAPTQTQSHVASKPAPNIMSLFAPQPTFQPPFPQPYGYPQYPTPASTFPPPYVPPHMAAGGPMGSQTPQRRKVNSTNDVMALF